MFTILSAIRRSYMFSTRAKATAGNVLGWLPAMEHQP